MISAIDAAAAVLNDSKIQDKRSAEQKPYCFFKELLSSDDEKNLRAHFLTHSCPRVNQMKF